MRTVTAILFAFALLASATHAEPPQSADPVQTVIARVENECRERNVYMVGPEKARRLAELVRQTKPKTVIECGTAIGYSALWIGRELKNAGSGRLTTIEIDPARAREATENIRRAGLDDYVTVRIGDAAKIAATVEGPIHFAFIDCNGPNYYPAFKAMEANLADGALVVADNAGISAASMKDYLDLVRGQYESRTEWFDLNLPWARRDALEVTVIRKKR